MYDENNGERLPGQNPELEKRGEYADVWENANMMEDAPEFQGEDPYNPQLAPEEVADGTAESGRESATEAKMNGKFGGAEDLTSYGLDTAAKIYGLDTVLKTIEETDETGRDANDPIGSIYSRLAPNPDERKHLYDEMHKEDEENDRDQRKEDEPADVNNAIRQMKVLLEAISNDPRFDGLRQRAASEGKDVVSYLTSGEINPTLSSFFNGLDAEGGVDEILDQIAEEEAAKEVSEIEEKVSEGEALSVEDAERLEEAKEELGEDAVPGALPGANVARDAYGNPLDDGVNPEMLK